MYDLTAFRVLLVHLCVDLTNNLLRFKGKSKMDILNKISIAMLMTLATACSSTHKTTTSEEPIAFSPNKTITSEESISFSVNKTSSVYELNCKPLNSTVAKNASWVQTCNSTAYEFLVSETNTGVIFEKEISQQPFGQAAIFMANMLKSNPQNFEATSIRQTYSFKQ